MSQVVPHNRRWLRELSGVQCCGRFHKDAPDCGPSSDCLAHAPKSFHLFDSSAVYIVEYVLYILSIRLSKRRRVKEREKRCPRSPNAEMRTMDDFLPSLHLLFVFLQKMPLNSLFFANNKKAEKMEAVIWLLYLDTIPI